MSQALAAETPFETARRQEDEAKAAAHAAALALLDDLLADAARCIATATLTALPPGARDALPRLAEKVEAEVQSVRAILVRNA